MNLYTYQNNRGTDLIYSYINSLSKYDKLKGSKLLERIETNDRDFLNSISKPLRGRIKEIRFGSYRLIYIVSNDDVYVLHIFKKEKNKTEKTDIDIGITRAKELGQELGKKFI